MDRRQHYGKPITGITLAIAAGALETAPAVSQTIEDFVPVTEAMLRNPDPADWLMYSRTYDAQRFSPLDQIDRDNVADLAIAWTKPLPAGVIEIIPIVYDGVMYLTVPPGDGEGGGVMAIDATTGETLWHYHPEEPLATRVKTIAIYGDMIYFSAPASGDTPEPVIALDAATGAVRWQTPVTPENHTAGTFVANGKVISGRTCNTRRENCYIAAHDAETGEEAWRFYTAPDAGEPGDESWAGTPPSERRASTWGLAGTYDPERNLVYWGISNPMPNTRADRHGGDPRAIPDHAPADLYSNSTVALDADTGELVWYYQHLPGDDWDMDINHEKMLLRTVIDPDPAAVKWINPDIDRGEARDVVVTSGEGGGIWVNDRDTGEFIWAMPFPYDTPHFILSDIDVETGATKINWDSVLTEPGANRTICFWNTRNYWPTAYHPELNSLYIPYFDYCLSMTRSTPDGGRERRTGARRPGADPEKFAGIAKIDMTTGEIDRIYEGRVGGNGAMLTTAGGLLFWGDIMQVFHAFDAATGEKLWRSEPLGSTIITSTITYAVDGRQYVAVVNGNAALGPRTMAQWGGFELPEDKGNAITVFALPE
ncbi:MAG TPA: PQQ-binding-like beta-propeller repeat protein [Gammaproteobacteria bacterium]|nr:PQQ-binding-like beta-propeller repeat protein [Gammaproteobacteria bacterium]